MPVVKAQKMSKKGGNATDHAKNMAKKPFNETGVSPSGRRAKGPVKMASPEMSVIAKGTQNPQMVLEHMKKYPGYVKVFGGSQKGSGRHAATNDIQFGGK